VKAELVYVDLALSGGFDPTAVRGKVALARRGEIKFSEKASNLASAGAIGVVIFNSEAGAFQGALDTTVTLPTVSISREDGEQLLDRLNHAPVAVRLRVDADQQERSGINVVAAQPAAPHTVVIGAHYDSVSAGPGANDNGSGTAVLLELARLNA